LIIFRGLQGIAGALLVPSSLAIIISNFKGAPQAKAIGVWTAWTGISFIIGPLVGGILVDAASWRWIFAINVLPIAVTLYLLRRVEADRPKQDTKIDFVGALLCALGLGGPVFALIEESRYGWSSPLIYIPLIAGAVLFVTFLLYEWQAKHPMLPLAMFRRRNFSVGNIATLGIYAGLSVATFLIVLFLQQVVGYSALRAGLALLPVTLIMFFLSPRFGALAGRRGPRWFMGFGPLVAGTGFIIMARAPADLNYWTQLLPGIVIFGLGLSATVAPLTAAILGDVPSDEAGIASAVNNAVARVAGLVAVAAVGAIVALQFGHTLDKVCSIAPAAALSQAKQAPLIVAPPSPYQHDQAFRSALIQSSVSAFHTGMLVTGGLVMAGGVVSLIGIRNPKHK
jgi:EmrB/QacA subfamily drug resistance transporter